MTVEISPNSAAPYPDAPIANRTSWFRRASSGKNSKALFVPAPGSCAAAGCGRATSELVSSAPPVLASDARKASRRVQRPLPGISH
jgi:hypothetical protein